jgi:hypothetical protein
MKGTKGHRDRKNGASREQWQARKAATNAERPKQSWYKSDPETGVLEGYWRRSPMF